VPWWTKVGRAQAVEHRSKASADRAVEEARQRYRNGAKTMRLVRVIDPDGNLQIIDVERDEMLEAPELAAIADARRTRDRAEAAAKEATAEWRRTIRAARATGLSDNLIARAAGTTSAEIRRLAAGP
jgi:hypothetical protein